MYTCVVHVHSCILCGVCVCVCVLQIGWTAVVGAVVWQRMLKILGDVNAVSDPAMHHLAFQTLLTMWRRLVEVSWRGGGIEGEGRREGWEGGGRETEWGDRLSRRMGRGVRIWWKGHC